MMKTAVLALALTAIGMATTASARQIAYTKPTTVSFTQPWEIPGTVFPAGTYSFRLADAFADRHIVHVYNEDGSKLLATVMTISDYRQTATNQTVLTFNETASGTPQAIRAWFYPGERFGREFVYSKARAKELAAASRVAVPAFATDVTTADDQRTAQIVAVTPDREEVAVATVIQTSPAAADTTAAVNAPAATVGTAGRLPDTLAPAPIEQTGQSARNERLPQTATSLPLLVLLGLSSIVAAFAVMAFGKTAPASV